MQAIKPKYYKVIVTIEYYNDIIVKANSKEDVEAIEDKIVNEINLLDNIPEVNVVIEERPEYDENDVSIDLTKELKQKEEESK